MTRLAKTSRNPATSAATIASPAMRPHGGSCRCVKVVITPTPPPMRAAKVAAITVATRPSRSESWASAALALMVTTVGGYWAGVSVTV